MTVALRSLLFAPGNEPRKVKKVASFGADAIILDLEDAVPNADKVATRPMVREAVRELQGALVCVRVNALTTRLTAGDVDGVVVEGLDAIVLPKTESADDVLAVDRMIAAAERREGLGPGRVRLLPLVETARGVLAASTIAGASERVLTIAFGSGDFTRDLEIPAIRWSLDGVELAWARAKLVVDARAAGKPRPIDGPYIAVRDAEGMAADCRVAKTLGYQGKICIHPSQVAPANRVFAPDADEVAFCRKVVTAFQAAEQQGSASITVDGIFVDYPIVEKAERIIRLGETLEAKDRATHAAAAAGRQP
jgi:citrate lyase subunit beta / citryl-CoA lyase